MDPGRSLSDLYPPRPVGVPEDLSKPTGAYMRHTWLAFGGLLLFVALYLGLTWHFGWTAFRLVSGAISGDHVFPGVLLAVPSAFFCAFLVRGLFVVKHREDPTRVELKEEDEPELFLFVRRVADEAGAPRPHRVFVSPRVNAAVFYDLSFWNLVWPSKKNLELGLGLVSALSLDELKAVIAHELGHFAQRSTAIGRWVYVADQIAGHVIVSRSSFDRALHWISTIDLRVAWIGWIMRVLVWAIRAVLDTFYRVILLTHHALSREMELQADLVAVSLSGSDSLIHALHRLGPADDAWDRAVGFVDAESAAKRPVRDLFAVQARILEHLRVVLDDAELGRTPPMPKIEREGHRVFETELAQPPRMWSTHPPNREREDNAKRRYFASSLDDRPAWELFRDPSAIREAVTCRFIEKQLGDDLSKMELAPLEDSLKLLDEDFTRPPLDRRYRGAYLGRSVVRAASTVDELYDPELDQIETHEEALARLDALYPDSLVGELEKWQELRGEKALLTALQDGVLSAPGGVIRYRGQEIPRKQLATVVERVSGECDGAQDEVQAHDRAARTAHRAAARLLGEGWEDYLVSLAELLFYADHSSANLRDAHDYVHHVFRIVIADGHISNSERQRMLACARDLWRVLNEAYSQRESIVLPERVAELLEKERWDEVLSGPFGLNPPDQYNLGDWLAVMDSWALVAIRSMRGLSTTTLEALLEAEALVEEHTRDETDPGEAPAPAEVGARCSTLVIGQERERQKKLGWWDRFQLADGLVPGAARLGVASALLVPTMLFTGAVGSSTLHVYNGLAIPVEVDVAGERSVVGPHTSRELEVESLDDATIVARTRSGQEIERFEADLGNGWTDYVYNVASASALVEWTAVYGRVAERPERDLGAPRFFVTHADAIFTDPPHSVSGSGSGSTRDVLTGLADESPSAQLSVVSDPVEQRALIEAHLAWDPTETEALSFWAALAWGQPGFAEAVRARLEREPGSIYWLRIEQDSTEGDAHQAVCARHVARAERAPDDAGLAYLAIRCVRDPDARGAAYIAAYREHPESPWLALAVAYELAGDAEWESAEALFERSHVPELGAVWSGVAVELARVRRVRAPAPRLAALSDLADGSRALRMHMLYEGITPPDESTELFVRPFRIFARGELGAALDEAGAIADEHQTENNLLRLVAASEGAPAMLVDRAWALPADAGIGANTMLATLALAVREGRDPSPFMDAVRAAYPDDAEAYFALLDAGRLAADPALMAYSLRHLSPSQRGQGLVMGIVLLGDAAPEEWRTEARALLFDEERPYFSER